MHCIKRLGRKVMSHTFERQVNELHIRIAILNRFTELGRPQPVARLGQRKSGPTLIYARAPIAEHCARKRHGGQQL